MFDWLISALNAIISPITALFGFLANLIEQIGQFMTALTDGIDFVASFSSFIPPFVAIFNAILTAMGITLILKIIGR